VAGDFFKKMTLRYDQIRMDFIQCNREKASSQGVNA
jgi:hypothetical protein